MIPDKDVFMLKDEPGQLRLEVVDRGHAKDFSLVNNMTVLMMNEEELQRVTKLLTQYDKRYVHRMKTLVPWGLVVLLTAGLLYLGVFA